MLGFQWYLPILHILQDKMVNKLGQDDYFVKIDFVWNKQLLDKYS